MTNKQKKFNEEVYEEILNTVDTSKEKEDFIKLTKTFKPSKTEEEMQIKYETISTHPLFMKPIEEYNRRMGTNFKRLDEVWDARMEDKIDEQFENFAHVDDEYVVNMDRLKLLAPKEREVFIVTIVADSNDADYITNIQTYPREGFLKETLDQIINLKTNYSGHYQLREYPYYDDDFDYPLDIPSDPYNDKYYYCHSLESLDVKYVDETGYTWDVEV